MPSFLLVTGPKTDLWLVCLVGALITLSAAALAVSLRNRHVIGVVTVIGMGSAFVLLMTDIICVSLGIISSIYLVDALLRPAFSVAGWSASAEN